MYTQSRYCISQSQHDNNMKKHGVVKFKNQQWVIYFPFKGCMYFKDEAYMQNSTYFHGSHETAKQKMIYTVTSIFFTSFLFIIQNPRIAVNHIDDQTNK